MLSYSKRSTTVPIKAKKWKSDISHRLKTKSGPSVDDLSCIVSVANRNSNENLTIGTNIVERSNTDAQLHVFNLILLANS